MPYDPVLVQPTREEVTAMGTDELVDAAQVEEFMSREGTKLIFINSVCGCAAGQARPALRIAMQHVNRPQHVATVFAGQDVDATGKARSYAPDVPPSSPSAMLFNGTELVHFLPRHVIESRDAQSIAFDLVSVFDQQCA